MPPPAFLAPIEALDPALARALKGPAHDLPEEEGRALVATILWAVEAEIHFGEAVAEGFGRILAAGGRAWLAAYREAVRRAGAQGAGIGLFVARHLPAVLLAGDPGLAAAFQSTLDRLASRGLFLLKEPLEVLERLLNAGDRAGARDFLMLLPAVLDRPLSYRLMGTLAHLVPQAVWNAPREARGSRMAQLARLAQADPGFLEPFLDGLERGLERLEPEGLERFVGQALEAARGDRRAGLRFLALASHRARRLCRRLQVAVSLEEVRAPLAAYLRARCGREIPLRPLAELPGAGRADSPSHPAVATDGRSLFLPAEIRAFPDREANLRLLEALARFESAVIEFDTFAFDLERALAQPACRRRFPGAATAEADADSGSAALTDLERFWGLFPSPALAAAVFTVVEHGRLLRRLARRYPGLVRRHLPALREPPPGAPPPGLLAALYRRLALHAGSEAPEDRGPWESLCRKAWEHFDGSLPPEAGVEAGAEAACRIYGLLENRPEAEAAGWSPPWRLGLRPDAFRTAFHDALQRTEALFRRLRERGLAVHRGDLLRPLLRGEAALTAEALQDLLRRGGLRADPEGLAGLDRDPETRRLLRPAGDQGPPDDGDVTRIHWFREWDRDTGDYLHRHVRVRDRRLPETADDRYARVLEAHAALVHRTGRAFEMLKPQGVQILRHWVDGDDLDYRALLEFATDRRMGRRPSERLYLKRLKPQRDVAVLLLVDVSRSTANIVAGSRRTVLEVAQDALVLFSQALERLGDRYAIAAYSGTGRLGVDYFRVKDFDEPLSAAVRRRIGALAPQRSTRMGAAVRRAALDLRAVAARVRLLILLGDGFPNDLDYKQAYAVEDTRRALWEARAHRIWTHAITVNLPGNTRLDDLYGQVHHNVISEVGELPDKLLRIYGRLTRG